MSKIWLFLSDEAVSNCLESCCSSFTNEGNDEEKKCRMMAFLSMYQIAVLFTKDARISFVRLNTAPWFNRLLKYMK